MTKTIRLIIIDDHPLILQGFKYLLSSYSYIDIVGEGSNGYDALSLVESTPCDILLLDVNMPLLSGIDTIKVLNVSYPDLKIILLTAESNLSTLKDALDLNVNGYLLKDTTDQTLIAALEQVYHGKIYIDPTLTKYLFNLGQSTPIPAELPAKSLPDILKALSQRELLILFYISEGLTNKEISQKLFLAEKTIRNIITVIFKKIGVKDRVQATILALTHDISSIIEKFDISSIF